MAENEPKSGEPGSTPAKKKRRRWPLLLGAFLVVLICFVLLLPTLISTGPGTRMALGFVNKRLEGAVEVQKLKVSWFGGQRVDGLRVRDALNADILSAEQIDAPNISLISTAMGSGQVGSVTLKKPVLRVEQYEDGTTNLQRLMGAGAVAQAPPQAEPPAPDKSKRRGPREFSLSIEVVDAEVTYAAAGQAPIVTNIPSAVVDISDPRKIRVKAKGTVTQDNQTGNLDVDAQIDNLFDKNFEQTIDKAKFNAKADLQQVPVALLDGLAKQEGLLLALIGPSVDGDLNVTGNIANLNGRLNVKSQYVSAQAQLTGNNERVTMQAVSPLELTITPQAWSAVSKKVAALGSMSLVEPVTIRATFKQLDVPLDAEGRLLLTQAALKADLQLDDLIVNAGKRRRLGVRQTNLAISSANVANAVSLTGSSIAVQGDHSGRVGLNIGVNQLFNDKGQINKAGMSTNAQIELTDVPVAIVEGFAPAAKGAVEMVGPLLTAKLDAQLRPVPDVEGITGPISLTATAEHLSANLNLELREDLSIVQPDGRKSFIELMMTPEGLDRLLGQVAPDKPRQIELTRPSKVRLDVDKALIAYLPKEELPTPDALPIHSGNSKLLATLTADAEAMRFPQTPELSGKVSQVRIVLNAEDPSDYVQLDAEVSFDESIAPGQKPTFVSTNRITRLIDANGALDLKSAAFNINATAAQFPVPLLDAVLQRDGQLVELLGQRTDLTLDATHTPGAAGQVALALNSQNARATVQGVIDEQKQLTLTEDIKAYLTVTPQLSKRYLAPINPLLADAQSSQNPIELTVSKDGFLLPLDNPDLAHVKMAGQLDIGTLRMKRGGLGGALVTGLRAAGSPIQDRQQFDAAFTTLQFAVADGVIRSNDLWMDTGDLLLGTQARVSQVGRGENSQLYGDVLMAVPGQTVRLIPKVGKRIRPEALYELPVSGPLSQLKPDFASLFFSIAAEAGLAEVGGDALGQLVVGIGKGLLEKDKPKPTSASGEQWAGAKWANRPAVDRQGQATEEPGQEQPQRKRKRKKPNRSICWGNCFAAPSRTTY